MSNFNKTTIFQEVTCLECVNKIESLINKILYTPSVGFLFLKSKNALVEKENFIKKFEYETDKICQELKISINSEFLNKSRNKFVHLLNLHCEKQFLFWIDEVFDDYVSNLLFELSLDKTKVNVINSKISNLIKWYSDVKSLNNDDISKISHMLNEKINEILNKSEDDYLKAFQENKTDYKTYNDLWSLACEDVDGFLKIDLSSYLHLLNNQDVKFFQGLFSKLNCYKKTETLDELKLINSALKISKILDFKQKYDFITDIKNDFVCHLERNKNISEEDKIRIVKRRMEIFKKNNIKKDDYFLSIISV